MRFFVLFFIIINFQLNAQEIFVIDAITGLPIEGVSIVSKLQKFGTVSDKEGKLNISSFSPKDTLSIRHLAYETIQEIKSSIKKSPIRLYLKTNTLENVEILESRVKKFENTLTYLKATSLIILNTQSAQTADLLEKTMGIF